MNPFALHGLAYLEFYMAALVVGGASALMIKHLILNVDRNSWQPAEAIARELDPYEAAFLMGGTNRAFVAACAALAQHNVITIDRTSRTISALPGRDQTRLSALEQGILTRIQIKGGSCSFDSARGAVSGTIDGIRKRLADKGLVTDDGQRLQAVMLPWLWFMAIALGFSLPKIAMASAARLPHGFLVMLTFFAVIAGLGFFANKDKTIKGKQTVQALTANNAALKLTATTNPAALSLRDTALAYGVFGALAMTSDPFIDVMYCMRLQRSPGSGCGSSCGGGDGGGGCGGGCGGGGCGG